MAFIKVQKLVRNEHGEVLSGSAAIMDTVYTPGSRNFSKHRVIESLGKVVYFDKNLKLGIFQSPLRGLVEYCSTTGEFKDVALDDPRLPPKLLPVDPNFHTTFGDVWFLMEFLKKHGLDSVLGGVFQKKTLCHRLWVHILHSVVKDGSKISCEDWVGRSFVSYLIDAVPLHSLKSDTSYFAAMGEDRAKMAFFKAFVDLMKGQYPGFGKCCYVDSTPLPNDIENNPFNALSSHGVGECSVMTRLVLILDSETSLPVWYEIIPGNVLDLHTVKTVTEDVCASLGITVEDFVLDAGYVSKELLQNWHIEVDEQENPIIPSKIFTGRMPARKGFPHKTLYWKVKDLIYKPKYSFLRSYKTYFGVRKEIEVFGVKEYAYVYVDLNNALCSDHNWRRDHEEEYEKLKERDKEWKRVEYGFFILLSNLALEPDKMLDRYYGRTNIETVFKTSKEYLDLLPLRKWTDLTVRGKILSDIIATIVLLMLRKETTPLDKALSEYFGKLGSITCFKSSANRLTVSRANKQTTQFMQKAGIVMPPYISLDSCRMMIAPTQA